MNTIKLQRIRVNAENRSLEDIINDLKSKGIFNNQFKNFELEKDYGSCYYESDSPDLVFIEKESIYKKRLENFELKEFINKKV